MLVSKVYNHEGVFYLQVTTVPDEGENSFKMPRASVVHMTSTATRPQHMSQVSIHTFLFLLTNLRSSESHDVDIVQQRSFCNFTLYNSG